METPDPGDLVSEARHWDKKGQEALEKAINKRRDEDYRPFFCDLPNCQGFPHVLADVECSFEWGHPWDPKKANKARWTCPECGALGILLDEDWAHTHARPDQHPPKWDDPWLTWLVKSGRGAGKTFGASHLVNRVVDRVPRIGIVGVTGPTMRRDMIEGPSGILATAPPGQRPLWEPSKFELTWPNGAKGYCISAEEPDRLRGLNSSFAWLDEPAHMDQIEEVWRQLKFGLRDPGFPTKILCTTTPLPSKWIKDLIKHKRSIVTTVSTYRNLHNLNEEFKEAILEEYEGTLTGQQEIHGEVIDDVEGALWKTEMFRYVETVPHDLDRVVVSVDPAGSVSARADETGIVVVGKKGSEYFVLQDATGKYTPHQWASRVLDMVEKWHADAIVAEKNYGGLMVKSNIENVDPAARVILVDSRRGKVLRAEPIVGLYEQERVYHLRGAVTKLEEEQTQWIPGEGASPNRLDANVHGITELRKGHRPSSIAIPQGRAS